MQTTLKSVGHILLANQQLSLKFSVFSTGSSQQAVAEPANAIVTFDPASRQSCPAAQPSDGIVDSIAGGALRAQDGDEAAICERLFKGLVFFLGREVPREQLLFVIRAFGGVVAWQGEGSPLQESDESITHQVNSKS